MLPASTEEPTTVELSSTETIEEETTEVTTTNRGGRSKYSDQECSSTLVTSDLVATTTRGRGGRKLIDRTIEKLSNRNDFEAPTRPTRGPPGKIISFLWHFSSIILYQCRHNHQKRSTK